MPFAYYDRLSARDQAIYRASDQVTALPPHLDYEHLRLPDSFHTEGFFKRESSLFYQLVPREGPTGWPRGDR